MATYTKVTDEKGTVRYKDGNKFVAADSVSDQAKSSLDENPEGTPVDELGDVINPSTEEDDSEDEEAPTNNTEDEAEAQDETPAETSATPQDDAGFGFKRSGGKTLSIFSNKPHETVKYVNGVLVPLTHEEYNTKTDAEIIEKLKKLKKL